MLILMILSRWVAFEQKGFLGEQFFWRRENILAGPPGPTVRAATASCPLDLWEWWERDTFTPHTCLKICSAVTAHWVLCLHSITGQRWPQTTSVRELQLCREKDGNRGWWHSQLVGSRLPGPCVQCQSYQRNVRVEIAFMLLLSKDH